MYALTTNRVQPPPIGQPLQTTALTVRLAVPWHAVRQAMPRTEARRATRASRGFCVFVSGTRCVRVCVCVCVCVCMYVCVCTLDSGPVRWFRKLRVTPDRRRQNMHRSV